MPLFQTLRRYVTNPKAVSIGVEPIISVGKIAVPIFSNNSAKVKETRCVNADVLPLHHKSEDLLGFEPRPSLSQRDASMVAVSIVVKIHL